MAGSNAASTDESVLRAVACGRPPWEPALRCGWGCSPSMSCGRQARSGAPRSFHLRPCAPPADGTYYRRSSPPCAGFFVLWVVDMDLEKFFDRGNHFYPDVAAPRRRSMHPASSTSHANRRMRNGACGGVRGAGVLRLPTRCRIVSGFRTSVCRMKKATGKSGPAR